MTTQQQDASGRPAKHAAQRSVSDMIVVRLWQRDKDNIGVVLRTIAAPHRAPPTVSDAVRAALAVMAASASPRAAD
jgi:hypothetical protein